jgi:MscS family membrane protein
MPVISTPRVRALLVLLLLCGLGLGLAVPSSAQAPPATPAASTSSSPGPSPASAEPEEGQEEPVSPDSPRASVAAYLDAARQGKWEEAARYLSLPADRKSDGPKLAEELKAVLDRYLWLDLEQISAEPGGQANDSLPAGVDQLGEIPAGDGRSQPVRIVRTHDDAGRFWAFSRNTVRSIDGWYGSLDDRWIREKLSELGLDRLLLPGPFEIQWWQWIALPLFVIGAWILGRILGTITRTILGRIFARTRTSWDDRLLARVGAPLTFAWGLGVFYAALPMVGLAAPAERLLNHLVAAGAVIAVFWALWRSVNVFADILIGLPWAASSPSARNLLMIGSNLTKGAIAFAGAVAVLNAFGYPVATLLAGLGIGGLAFAFGAQKTVENLFGSISLAVDQPFRVGDFVKVEDFVGTVEDIGLRSTRFRTLDRTLISIPNGKLSDQRLESFAARDRMRLATTIGVEYGTTHDQMTQVLEGFERVLREHPKIWPDAMVVKFKEFGASSLDIEIMAWFQVPTWGDFQLCRQEVLLGFMKVVEDAGTAFAFPTRTVHLIQDSPIVAAAPAPGAGGRPRPAAPEKGRPQDLPTTDE